MSTITDVGAYSSGDWRVRAGSEDAFVDRWREFLEWSRASAPGFVSARLVRDVDDARHFLSIGEWQTEEATAAWRGMPEFAAKLGACRELCEQVQASAYTPVVRVA